MQLAEVYASEEYGEYDWEAVFSYATQPRLTLPDKPPASSYDRPIDDQYGEPPAGPRGRGFERVDVKEVLAYANGDNDGPDWLMLGELHDGRYFFVYAGCDYTGWDCRASGGAYVADSPDQLIRWAMADEDRQRLNLPLTLANG